MMPDEPISNEDRALFRELMSSVTPLKNTPKIQPPTLPKKTHQTIPLPNNTLKSIRYLSNDYQDTVLSETTIAHLNQAIPKRRFRALINGEIPWQARLDLHGSNIDVARDSLSDFIEQHYQAATSCVLIIHGKGGLQGEAPIIKNHVNHWLKQYSEVLAFHSARPRDGGNGALYVLLKRPR
jgi:DNA-nicking Smr family endonuclease